MGSGKKERIVIGCITFETVKVTDPAIYYDATRVHLIHYVKKGLDESKANVFREFYDHVHDAISEGLPNATIIEHNERVSDFSVMLRTVLSIIETEQNNCDCDIYINISAGTSEYAAAATIASMMSKDVIPFTVGNRRYTISDDDAIRKAFYIDDKPVGLTSETLEPKTLPIYTIDKPPEHLVKGLRILDREIDEGNSTSSSKMGPKLIDAGIWIREERQSKKNEKQSFAVNYHRDFMTRWIELGWVEKDKVRNRDIITEKGRNVLNTFYVDG